MGVARPGRSEGEGVYGAGGGGVVARVGEGASRGAG